MRRLMRTTRAPGQPPLQRSRRRPHPSLVPHPPPRRSRQEEQPSRRQRRSTAASPRLELSVLSPLCELATSRSSSSHFTLSFLPPQLYDSPTIADPQHHHAQRQEHQGRLCRLNRGEQARPRRASRDERCAHRLVHLSHWLRASRRRRRGSHRRQQHSPPRSA